MIKKYGKSQSHIQKCNTCEYEQVINSAGVMNLESGSVRVYADDDEFSRPNCENTGTAVPNCEVQKVQTVEVQLVWKKVNFVHALILFSNINNTELGLLQSNIKHNAVF